MSHDYWATFVELVRTPFQQVELVWGIVPLYFSWLANELTSSKASFRTAVQTGFGFLWGGAHWTWQYLQQRPSAPAPAHLHSIPAVNLIVTALVLVLGALALVSGLRRRYPRGLAFLGHTRFSAYFMIAIFPIQSDVLPWTWDRLLAIAIFAVPIWVLLHFGLMPLRR